ncbi:rhomboid family intramembrane serine protease [Alterisphingorhabdus coralli]|uniref:Rhomboid family intramembrane serine protease n=1 Tax=Alterisphingorhabdus coralli TaxID=3071408 RepID=A0AA97I0T3_9SPHN|nr:rhomboid family intramembrane serine protease [Parasphingorhabdus sp. SCSIO 66989]WOE74090.1 rhomboid family intramembrane serine protease [Parasphingorhabdus sp. SCSIO 66989]
MEHFRPQKRSSAVRKPGPFTLFFAGACVLLWLGLNVTGLQEQAAMHAGFVPARFFDSASFARFDLLVPALLTPLSSAFLHVDFVHLLFNMLILLLCGTIVERVLGSARTLLLTVAGAYGAAFVQAFDPFSIGAVTIGASGAISALIAATILLNVEIKQKPIGNLTPYHSQLARLAFMWVLIQLALGIGGVSGQSIAIGAHIGGFLTGLVLTQPLTRSLFPKA